MSLHAALADEIVTRYGERLVSAPVLAHDALTLELENGVRLQARFAGPEEYAIVWELGGQPHRIDTAPLHAGLATFPNHLHIGAGAPRSDPLTRPGAAPLENLCAVIQAVLDDPALARYRSA